MFPWDESIWLIMGVHSIVENTMVAFGKYFEGVIDKYGGSRKGVNV